MINIDWQKAPEWANWVAMDKDQNWCWYEKKPFIFGEIEVWVRHLGESGRYAPALGFIPPVRNWEFSLQKRGDILNSSTPVYYDFEINGVKIDPYRIASIYKINSHPHFHALKKVLRAHLPNHKSLEQNIDEAITSLQIWKERLNEERE